MSEHTPGPWVWTDERAHMGRGAFYVQDQGGVDLAIVYGRKPGNAILMASAPELADRLEAVAPALHACAGHAGVFGECEEWVCSETRDALRRVRSA